MQGESSKTFKVDRCVAFAYGICATLALLILGAPSIASADTPVFDPVLSLTGGCKVTATDPVADPSCPGGPLPSKPFTEPKAIATDPYGNIYVSVNPEKVKEGGRVDIFDSEGFFITELKAPKGPKSIAVDTEGNLYVFLFGPEANELVRYAPKLPYNPAAGEISYPEEPTATVPGTKDALSPLNGIAINQKNNHLFVHRASYVAEYDSAKEENKLLSEIGKGDLSNPIGNAPGLAVDAADKRIYASSSNVVKVFELEAPHTLLMTIEGSDVPETGDEFAGQMSLGANEGSGHFFIYDAEGSDAIYEFSLEGAYLATIEHEVEHVNGAEIAVDNGEQSPNGAQNLFGRYLYVPSGREVGHSFAFGPPRPKAPEITSISFAGVTEEEAELRAAINPNFLETTYSLEYTTLENFKAEEWTGAQTAASGSISAGGSPVKVAASLTGLSPDTPYVFRALAENKEGPDQAVRDFATYSPVNLPSCPNDPLRNALSKLLPDCRAYELATPSDTNGRAPLGVGHLGSGYFATRQASPGGDAVTFEIEGGSIPGFEATGSYAGDPYLTKRTEHGWSTEYVGPSGEEAPALLPGSNSPDQGYSFWQTANGEGTAAIEGKVTKYVRYPDGHSNLVGRGSLGVDPRAQGLLIGEGGEHIIFSTGGNFFPIQLEEEAPPDGTEAIYDRTADEVTHVVSLLPKGKTPLEGEDAVYEGASLDGRSVAFRIGKTLYFRYNDEETYELGENVTFAGFAANEQRAFYLESGNLFAYEVGGTENPIQFSSAANVTPVNVAAGGNVAYFVSPSVLTSEPNPQGDPPVNGEENLYRSEEGAISFVGTVTEEDVLGEETGIGLGRWAPHVVSFGEAAEDPSRAAPDGSVLLFESEASLTDYEPEGHTEIYRYDSTQNELNCLSCNPTLAPAAGDGTLQSASREQGAPEPFGFFASIPNLRNDGRRAFFQSTEPLVLADTDELQDVYEWEAQGVGSCEEAGGCVYLISYGHSHRADYLWAISDSGNDVFFRSSDQLLGVDSDATPSLYDARVEGGFAEPVEEKECEGEGGCWHGIVPPPGLTSPGSGGPGSGNPAPAKSCPKGKHKAKRNGKTVCVKNKKHKKHHRKAGNKRKGAGK